MLSKSSKNDFLRLQFISQDRIHLKEATQIPKLDSVIKRGGEGGGREGESESEQINTKGTRAGRKG